MIRAVSLLKAAAAILPLVLLAGPLSGCAGSPSSRRAILIMLDAARPDRFGCYGYPKPTTPSIDALAAHGAVFRNHFTQGTFTRTALPPLLYSRYYVRPVFPNSDQVPYSTPEDLFRTLDAESISLPRALGENGVYTVMISAHTWLRPGTEFAGEFDETYDLSSVLSVDEKYGYPRAEDVIDFTIDWLRESPHDDFFIYLHLMDTHFPHHLDEDARALLAPEVREAPPVERFTTAGAPKRLDAALSGPDRAYMDALYDGSLRYTDRHVGRLLDQLGDKLDDSLVIVTSDHGEYLLERPGRLGHGYDWYDAMGRVPFILAYPRVLAPADTDILTESVDIVPTVLSLLGVPYPSGKAFDGVDLQPILRGEAPPKNLVLMPRAARTRDHKIIFQVEESLLLGQERPELSALAGKLYDLEEDPEETIDLWASRPEILGDLLDRYRDRMTRPYRRYLEARTASQPESAFAISAKYLATVEEIPVTTKLEELETFMYSKEGWIHLNDSQGNFLVATGDAGPVTIEIPIPNGPYLVSAAIRGTCTLRIGPPEAHRELEGRAFDPSEYFPWTPDRLEYGRIDVTDEVFRAMVDPDPGRSPLLISYIGFEPLGAEEEVDPEEERERLERLKTLGYVE